MPLCRLLPTFLIATVMLVSAANAQVSQIARNPEFDEGTSWWYVHGSGRLKIVDDSNQSENGCKIRNRKQHWNGPAQPLLGQLETGKDYHFKVHVKTVGIPSARMNLEIMQDDDRGTSIVSIGSIVAVDDSFTLLQGGFKLESNGELSDLAIIVNSHVDDPGTFDFVVDSLEITENDWLSAANTRIEAIRKRDAELVLVDNNGIPLPAVQIEVQQINHEFPFGSALNDAVLVDPVYADFFSQHFEWGTLEWFAQWVPVEQVQGIEDYSIADAQLDYARDNGIRVRGHALAWSEPEFVPTWLDGQSDADLESELEDRIANAATHFSSKFESWDVCNEMLDGSFFMDRLGESIRPGMFQQARISDSSAKLFTNEYDIVRSQEKAIRYRELIQYLESNGAEIGGIGLQGHFPDSFVSPKAIEIGLNELSDLGHDILISEFDVSNVDDEERAKALETFYRYAFSRPEIKGITMWGFWADAHWRGPDAALVDSDWTINAAGQKYLDLIEEWTTETSDVADSNGEMSFRGFHGDYLITTTNPATGIKNYHLVDVPSDDNSAIPMPIPLVLDIIPDSLTIYGTPNDDVFEYDLNDKSKLMLNGEPVVFSLPADTSTVRFAGLGGNDTLKVIARTVNSDFRITDRQLTSLKENFKVRYTNIESADFVASTPGSTVTMIDSPGDDTFESYHEASTLITPSITLSAKNFRYVFARSISGGADSATLYDTPNIDRVHSDLNIVSIKWGARNRRAIGFASTEVISSQSNDLAGFSLPLGDKTINVGVTESIVTMGHVTHKFSGFARTNINGADGNNDTILLSDSPADETIRIAPDISRYYNSEVNYFIQGVPNFETVGLDAGGTDILKFIDTTGDDNLVVAGNSATITGTGYSHSLNHLEEIDASGVSGGTNTANISGATANVDLIGDWQQ
jgi:GH35 family endo-1,4-beta-xylanase